MPDVTAYELPEAQATLAAVNWTISRLVESRPPGAAQGVGIPRVTRQRVTGPREVELVIVYTHYERPA